MSDPSFTLAEELRFLGIQCMAQARGTHRDQDREFLSNLVGRLFECAPNLSVIYARLLFPAADLPGANLPALLMTAAKDLSSLANDLEQHMQGRAA
ncbi:MAG: hypothetical protein ACRDBL_09215 [Rhabdaerophilum sp.]